jgi:soluble lytic murein transglycosylase-like protein
LAGRTFWLLLAAASCATTPPQPARFAPALAEPPFAAPSAPSLAIAQHAAPPAPLPAVSAPPSFEPQAAPESSWIRDLLLERAPSLSPDACTEIAERLEAAQEEVELDPLLVLAVIAQESRFDPTARGPRGSLGLMQVRPFVASDIAERHDLDWDGPETLFDPVRNIEIGVAYLIEMLGMYADVEFALAAYNMGPYRLRKLLGRGQEPRGRYAGKVFEHYAELVSLAATIDPQACPAEYC